MTATLVSEGKGPGLLVYSVVGVASTDAGALMSVANPYGAPIFITRAWMKIESPSTGGANMNMGIGATATTDATDMINTLAINGLSANAYYNCHAQQAADKTAVSQPALWTSDKFLVAKGSASTAGFAAKIYVEYFLG